MKTITILLIILSFNASSQSRIGIINDPDGYTNIRQSKSTDSKIVTKFYNYQTFEFLDDNSNWLSVKLHNGQIGYIHKSRVREIKECSCKTLGVSKPMFVFPVNNQMIEVCGHVRNKINDKAIEITETQIRNCLTQEILLEISAVDYAILEIQRNKLLITKVKNLPIGKNWSFIKTPVKIWTLDLNGGNLKFTEGNGLKPPYVTAQESEKLVKFLKENPPKDAGKFEGAMYKLFVAAISGDKDAEQLFRDHKKQFGFTLDGYIAEDFGQLRDMLNDYQTRK